MAAVGPARQRPCRRHSPGGRARPTPAGQVAAPAPHLERLANDWVLQHALPDSIGGTPRHSGQGVIRRNATSNQVDVVVTELDRNGVDRVIAIGEVKAERSSMGVGELDRLDSIELPPKTLRLGPIRRLLFARAGFTAELRRVAARRGDVELIDLERLYGGN